MPKTIHWGILGCGKIAHKFATDLQQVTDAKLVSVASRNTQNAIIFAQKFNVQNAYNSYETLVNDTTIDAIYIATPHSFHKEHTLLCLQHQKAVLCEKPFAMNTTEVKEMIHIAKQNNVLLMEALWTYFLPHYQCVLDILKSKKYGNLLSLTADFGFKPTYDENSRLFNKSLGGGSLLDIGIYPIFAALSTLGIPEKIDANATFFKTGADASCDIHFEHKNASAQLRSTFLEETKTEAIFEFEKAIARLNTRFHEPTSITILENGKEQFIEFNTKVIGYYYEIVHFNQLLRDGKKESNIMTFDFSLNLIQLLDTVREKIGLVY